MALRRAWAAANGNGNGATRAGLGGTNASARARDEADLPPEDGSDLELDAPAPAEAVAEDPEAPISNADAKEIFSALVAAATRIEALEQQVATLTTAGSRGAKPAAPATLAAPRKAADPLRPSDETVGEWARAALAAAKLAGRWGEPKDVANLVAQLVNTPALALVGASESMDDPTEIAFHENVPTGAPICLAKVILGALEMAAAWGIDLSAAMSVAHEHALASAAAKEE